MMERVKDKVQVRNGCPHSHGGCFHAMTLSVETRIEESARMVLILLYSIYSSVSVFTLKISLRRSQSPSVTKKMLCWL